MKYRLNASVVEDFKLAVLASLEWREVEGPSPRIALTSKESKASLSPDLFTQGKIVTLLSVKRISTLKLPVYFIILKPVWFKFSPPNWIRPFDCVLICVRHLTAGASDVRLGAESSSSSCFQFAHQHQSLRNAQAKD